MSSAEIRVRRLELQHKSIDTVVAAAADILKAGLSNPALTLIGGVTLNEWLLRKGYITSIDAGAINAVLISGELLKAFNPINISGLLK